MMIRTPDTHNAATPCESCGGGVPPGHADPSPGHVRCPTCVRADEALVKARAARAAALGGAPVVGRGPSAGQHPVAPVPMTAEGRGRPVLPALPAPPPVPSVALMVGVSVLVRLLVVLPVVGLLGGLPAGCDPTRRAALTVVAGAPDGCAAGAYRCHAEAPEVCSATGRWWPVLPVAPEGTPRSCTGSCRIDPRDGVAFCSPLPRDTAPGEDTPAPLPTASRPPGGVSAPPSPHGGPGPM